MARRPHAAVTQHRQRAAGAQPEPKRDVEFSSPDADAATSTARWTRPRSRNARRRDARRARGGRARVPRARRRPRRQLATRPVRTWTVDLTPPGDDARRAGLPSGPVQLRDAAFRFASPADLAGFECSLDAAAFATCTSPQTYSELADGAAPVPVRAVDTPATATPRRRVGMARRRARRRTRRSTPGPGAQQPRRRRWRSAPPTGTWRASSARSTARRSPPARRPVRMTVGGGPRGAGARDRRRRQQRQVARGARRGRWTTRLPTRAIGELALRRRGPRRLTVLLARRRRRPVRVRARRGGVRGCASPLGLAAAALASARTTSRCARSTPRGEPRPHARDGDWAILPSATATPTASPTRARQLPRQTPTPTRRIATATGSATPARCSRRATCPRRRACALARGRSAARCS